MLHRKCIALGLGLGLFSWVFGTTDLSCGGEALRWRFAKGDRLHYRVAMNAKSRMGAGESTRSLVLDTTWLVVNAEQGLAEFAVTLDGIYFRSFVADFGTLAEYSSLTRNATGRLREPARKLLAELLNALVGTPITFRVDAKGKMVDVKFSEKWKDAFKGEAAAELAGLFGYWISDPGMRSQLFLPMIEPPDGTPEAGESWTRQRDLVVWDVPETRAALSWIDKYTYEGDEPHGAASLAKLAMTRTETLTVVKPRTREPFTQKITSQGTVLFDRAEGRTIECRLKQDGTTGDCAVTATLVNKE